MILDYDRLCRAAIEKGAERADLFAIPVREKMGRAKSVPDDQYHARLCRHGPRRWTQQIEAIAARGRC